MNTRNDSNPTVPARHFVIPAGAKRSGAIVWEVKGSEQLILEKTWT